MTSYFVVFSFRGTSGGLFGVGTSDDAATGLTGWTMADSALARRHTSALTASWDETSLELGVRLRGSPLGGPVVTGLAITSEPAYDYGNYNHAAGDVIQATVTFNEAVTVQTTGGTPRLALTVGSNTRYANYSATVSTATELVFAYPVTVNDKDEDGISIVANALELNGGAIHEQGDTSTDALLGHGALPAQAGHLVNAAPVIVSGGVEVISTPAATTDTYGADETIEIQVEFSEAVTATADTDFVLSVGSAKRARLLRDNDTTKLVFGYTVQAGDEDDNGIWIGDHDRTLVGNRRGDPQNGEITSLATGRAADLRHGDLRTQSGHKVNGDIVTPRVTIAVADPDRPAFTAELDDVTFTLERTGSTAAALDVDVALTQDPEFLATEYRSPTVAFQAGESMATLTVHRSGFDEVDRDGTLTATVQPRTGYVPGTANSATAQMLVVSVAVTVRLDRGSYAFDEDAAAADRTVTVIARTEPGIPTPLGLVPVDVSFVAIEGEARLHDDFEAIAEQLVFLPSDFSEEGSVYVARKAAVLVLVDDALVEDAETLTLSLQTAAGTPRVVAIVQHDGSSTACAGTGVTVCTVTATIIDDDEPDRALQTAGGATWTLIGERTPAPGGTYSYSIMLASGTKPAAEVVGFSARAGGPSTDQLGADPTACTAPLQFCASVPGGLVPRWLPDSEGGYAIFALLADDAPHTATATLAIATDTPAGTTIAFGPMDSALIPRAGGMTITVTERGGALPASNDATLRGLAVNDGTSDLRLTPAFTWTTTSYAAPVANTVDAVTVTPAPNDDAATVAYLDASDDELDDADDGKDGFQVALANGATTIRVKVTATDGAASQTYTVTVTRAAGDTAPVWSATMTAGDTQVGHGYDATDTPDTPAIGKLDDDNFNYGPTPATTLFYTVRAIDVANVFRFVVQPSLPTEEALTLEFGGHALAFSDRILAISIGGSSVWLVPAALDDLENEFPVGSTATVCLRTATQVCPPGRIVTPSALPTLSVADAAASEGGNVTFTATLSATAAADVTATWTASIGSGDTAADADLGTTKTGMVTVTMGQDTGTFDVPTAPDTDNEAGHDHQRRRAGRAGGFPGEGGRHAGRADVGRAGAGREHHAPRVSAEGGQRELPGGLHADPGERAGRHEREGLHGDGADERGRLHVRAAGGQRRGQRHGGRGGPGDADAGHLRPHAAGAGRDRRLPPLDVGRLRGSDGSEPGVDHGHSGLRRCRDHVAPVGRLREPDETGQNSIWTDNDLSSLPARVFSGLTDLTRLYLHDNDDLTSLPDDVFDGLTALENIRLFGTGLTSLPDGAFDGLTALASLRLHNNQLTSLPDKVFDGLTALATLHLSGNDLSSLRDEVFDGLTELTSLTLNDNDLDALPDRAFIGLTALETLSLDNNPDSGDDLPLTVTVEKVGTDQARANVATGAPFSVEFTPTERLARGQRHEARRGGGRGGRHGGDRDPHVRDDGGGDGGYRSEHPAVPAHETLRLRVRQGDRQ